MEPQTLVCADINWCGLFIPCRSFRWCFVTTASGIGKHLDPASCMATAYNVRMPWSGSVHSLPILTWKPWSYRSFFLHFG